MQHYRRASAAGRRRALTLKYELNVDHYGGKVKLLTLTPPGEDLLPFGDEVRKVSMTESHRLVDWAYRTQWNYSAQARATRLFEAAQRAADRWVRKQWAGKLPRQIGNVRDEQKRGVFHFHHLMPYETEIERVWTKMVQAYMRNAVKRELARWPEESERRLMIEREYLTGEIVRGFYGFGFVHAGNPAGASNDRAARYMGRNAAGYMAGNAVAGQSRHYVNAGLTRQTGVTMRALRSCNWLYVRRKLIDSGELLDSWIPSHWSEAQTASTLRVWALLNPSAAP
jgi:hypothetical protein